MWLKQFRTISAPGTAPIVRRPVVAAALINHYSGSHLHSRTSIAIPRATGTIPSAARSFPVQRQFIPGPDRRRIRGVRRPRTGGIDVHALDRARILRPCRRL